MEKERSWELASINCEQLYCPLTISCQNKNPKNGMDARAKN